MSTQELIIDAMEAIAANPNNNELKRHLAYHLVDDNQRDAAAFILSQVDREENLELPINIKRQLVELETKALLPATQEEETILLKMLSPFEEIMGGIIRPQHLRWRNGMIIGLSIPVRLFNQYADRIFEVWPISHLRLLCSNEDGENINTALAKPAMKKVANLHIILTDSSIFAKLYHNNENLRQLNSLWLTVKELTDQCVIHSNDISDCFNLIKPKAFGFTALSQNWAAASTKIKFIDKINEALGPTLKYLYLDCTTDNQMCVALYTNTASDTGAERWLGRQIQYLSLKNWKISTDPMYYLLDGARNLSALKLSMATCAEHIIQRIMTAPHLAVSESYSSLKHLCIDGFAAANCHPFTNILSSSNNLFKTLCISGMAVRDSIIASIANFDAYRHLESLAITGDVKEADVDKIFKASHLKANLRNLSIMTAYPINHGKVIGTNSAFQKLNRLQLGKFGMFKQCDHIFESTVPDNSIWYSEVAKHYGV